jgi:phosphoribosylamine-glycine ligase
MKKILVLAGGNDQCALIEELRRYFDGQVEIILADMSDKVKAIAYADRFVPVSTMDRCAVLKLAMDEKIDYILTACGDQPLSTMAYISEKMGLPTYLTEQDVRDLTNKRFMKDKMVANGIPTAQHIYIDKAWDGKMPDFKYPLVVKPVDSNGSKGVKKVFTPEELDSSLQEAFRFSISGDVIIEEFKSGEELSCDFYVENGVAKTLSITASKKIKENDKSFTIIQSYYPAPVSYSEERVLEIAQKIVDAWGLKDTPLLVQMIVNKDEYNVLEFSARMGGGSKYHLIQVLSGIDIMKVYVQMVMGEKPHVQPSKQWNNAIMSYVYCRPGEYVSLKGFDELAERGDIYSFFTYRTAPSTITKSDTSSDRVAGFLVVGDSEDEVLGKLKYANEHIAVLDAAGNDIMRHDLFNM